MFVNDVGAGAWEEINDGLAGANYGWPNTEGPTSDPRFTSPLFAYGHGWTDTTGCAISAGTFYETPTPQFPLEYMGDYFFADYCGGWIRKLDPAAGNVDSAFATGIAGPVDLKVGPDGNLYYLTRQDGVPGNPGVVFKVQYTGSPSISQQPADVTVAPGEPATFSVTASGQQPLSYQWQRDGVDIPAATGASYTLPAPATTDNGAQFRVVVSNAAGSETSASATLTVTSNSAPQPTILTPSEGITYDAGDTITFSGGATDPEDGDLPAERVRVGRESSITTSTRIPVRRSARGRAATTRAVPSRSPTRARPRPTSGTRSPSRSPTRAGAARPSTATSLRTCRR